MSLKTFEPNLNMLSNGFINCQISLDVIKASSDVHMIILIFEFRNILGCINVGVGTGCPKKQDQRADTQTTYLLNYCINYWIINSKHSQFMLVTPLSIRF